MGVKWVAEKIKKRPIIVKINNRKRQGCGFTNGDLSRVVEATGFSRAEVEKDMKAAFRGAEPDGKAVSVYSKARMTTRNFLREDMSNYVIEQIWQTIDSCR